MNITEKIITNYRDLPELEGPYRNLRLQYGVANMSMHWNWLSLWCESHLKSPDKLYIHCYFIESSIVGFIPTYLKKIPKGYQLSFIGTEEKESSSVCSEFQYFVINSDYENNILNLFLNRVMSNKKINVVKFRNILKETNVYNAFSTKRFTQWQVKLMGIGKRFQLPILEAKEEQINLIPNKSNRRKIRQYCKNSEIKCELVENERQFDETFTKLVSLHNYRWASIGVTGAFEDQAFTSFHYDFAKKMFESNNLILFSLCYESEVIAVFYGVVDMGTLHYYQSGIALNVFSYTGVAMHFEALNIARTKGVLNYDLMKGKPDSYKSRLCKETLSVYDLTFMRKSYRLWAFLEKIWKKIKLKG